MSETISTKEWIQDISRNFVNEGRKTGDKNLTIIGMIIPQVLVVEGEGPLEVMFDERFGRFKLINLPPEIPKDLPREGRRGLLATFLGAIAQGFSIDPMIVREDPVRGSLAVALRATSIMSKVFGPVGKYFTTPRVFGYPDGLSVSKYYEFLKADGEDLNVMAVDVGNLVGGLNPWVSIKPKRGGEPSGSGKNENSEGGEGQGRTAFVPAKVRIKC